MYRFRPVKDNYKSFEKKAIISTWMVVSKRQAKQKRSILPGYFYPSVVANEAYYPIYRDWRKGRFANPSSNLAGVAHCSRSRATK